MIELSNIDFKYNNSEQGILKHVSLTIAKGECVLLCGNSGCGKTTITRLLNGLIPHYYEGELQGKVSVCGMNVVDEEIYRITRRVGSVFQNPRSQFFCLDTTSELAFGCENLGIPEQEIKERMQLSVKELELENLLGRDIFKLSGGEKQQIACGSITAMQPDVFVLDEPTSNLDVEAIERLKQTLMVWKKQGKTIVVAEHRLYWLTEICDRVVYMDHGEIKYDLPMKEFVAMSEEKRQSLGLRSINRLCKYRRETYFNKTNDFQIRNYRFSYGKNNVLNMDDMSFPRNEIVAITGQNGTGKSTFVRCLCGLEKKFRGQMVVDGMLVKAKNMLRKCYLVMQDVNHQLFCESVWDEILLGTDEDTQTEEEAKKLMRELGLWEVCDKHPMSLSGGQKQRIAIAAALLADKEILVFDEPTSGLDYRHMKQTARLFQRLQEKGKSIFVITHDRELIEECCTCEWNIVDKKAFVYRLKH